MLMEQPQCSDVPWNMHSGLSGCLSVMGDTSQWPRGPHLYVSWILHEMVNRDVFRSGNMQR